MSEPCPNDEGPMIPNVLRSGSYALSVRGAHSPCVLKKHVPMNPHDSDRPGRSDSQTRTTQLDRESTNTSERNDSSSSPELSLDTIFDILSHSHRRHLLSYLSQTEDDLATVADLVSFILKQESETETSIQCTQDDAVRVALQHNHLPKLDDARVIEYDTQSETIRYCGHPTLEKCLSVTET